MKNVKANNGGASWSRFLTSYDVMRGYADAINGESWPKSPTELYEWGRYIGAEVRSLEGSAAPRAIPQMRRVTKEWQQRMNGLTGFKKLLIQHYTRTSH